jgi:hypothetical protein
MNRLPVTLLLIASLQPEPVMAQALSGVIDIHCHSDPDVVPRSIDALDLARLARASGERGIVLKNHYEPTTSMAYLIRKVVPGLEVFGGIDLNLAVGGVNPAAVEHMAKMKGGFGKVVWLPTFDAENQVRFSKEQRPFAAVTRNGQLLPEVKQVIALCAKYDLLLETGHSSAAEGLAIIREAKQQGVKHIVVTHAMIKPIQMTTAQMQEAAKLGAYIEMVYNALIGPNKEFTFAEYAAAIRAVGPEHCILSSDLGQAANPVHPEGLQRFFAGLEGVGLKHSDIDRMSKTNPAEALGLR